MITSMTLKDSKLLLKLYVYVIRILISRRCINYIDTVILTLRGTGTPLRKKDRPYHEKDICNISSERMCATHLRWSFKVSREIFTIVSLVNLTVLKSSIGSNACIMYRVPLILWTITLTYPNISTVMGALIYQSLCYFPVLQRRWQSFWKVQKDIFVILVEYETLCVARLAVARRTVGPMLWRCSCSFLTLLNVIKMSNNLQIIVFSYWATVEIWPLVLELRGP